MGGEAVIDNWRRQYYATYSPEYNPIEGFWKQAKKETTHNRFFHTTEERDAVLSATFDEFDARRSLIAA